MFRAAGVAAILLFLLLASPSLAANKDCGNGPSEFPGKGHPMGGHWSRCFTPPVETPPEPPPPVAQPPVVESPPHPEDQPPVEDVPRKKRRHRELVLDVSHPPDKGEPRVRVSQREGDGRPVAALVLLLGAGAGLGIAIGCPKGPSPLFFSGL